MIDPTSAPVALSEATASPALPTPPAMPGPASEDSLKFSAVGLAPELQSAVAAQGYDRGGFWRRALAVARAELAEHGLRFGRLRSDEMEFLHHRGVSRR